MKELTAATKIAIGKAVKNLSAVSAELPAGEYEVDTTVRIFGTFRRGEDNEKMCVQAARPWALFSVALAELNKTRNAAGEAGIDIDRLIEMAEKVDPALDKTAEKEAVEAITKIKGTTIKKVNGTVTTKLHIEVID